MGSQRLLVTIFAALALSAVGPSSGVWAQNAACPAGFEWNRNSLGQDPCTIASMLEIGCREITRYQVPPLMSGEYYDPPQSTNSGDLQCECNTVVYSLYEACTSCQSGLVLSWTNWTVSCTNLDVAGLPYTIPSGTAVPHWAYFDVTKLPGETYTDANAMSIGRDPESSPGALSISTVKPSSKSSPPSVTSTGGGSLPSSSSGSPSGTNPNSNKANSGNSIVGGPVGSVVPLTVFAVVAALILG